MAHEQEHYLEVLLVEMLVQLQAEVEVAELQGLVPILLKDRFVGASTGVLLLCLALVVPRRCFPDTNCFLSDEMMGL
jgi:hypothetical protein